MEAISAAQSDHLVASLDFRLKDDSASYVIDRQEVSYFAPSNFYSPTGVKVIRFSLSGTGFLDLSSLVFTALFTNDDSSKVLVPLCQEANSVFSRMRIVIGGSTAEDLQYFNRLSHTLFQCMPHERQEMLGALGFINDTAPSGGTHGVSPSEIPASGSETIVMQPFASGLCTQPLWLPMFALGSGGCVVELELCEATDMCNTASTHSTSWHLSDCRALASVITVDSALMEQYAQHLLSKPFLIPYKSWTTIMNALPDSSDWDVSIARSFTRLCTVMATLSQADSDNNKQVNTLYSPAGTAGDTIQTTLQAGDKKWSIYDRKGAAQQFYFLMQTLGQLNNPQGTISIKRHEFDTFKYINSFDLERVPQASMSGINLSTGGLLTLSMKGVGSTTSNRPTRCYVNCHYDAVAEITAAGCSIHT